MAKQFRQTTSGIITQRKACRLWEKTVAQFAQVAVGAGFKPKIAAVALEFHFLFPIAKDRQKELSPGDPHLQDPDLTNLIKAAEDGLKWVVFPDDNMVWRHGNSTKKWCERGKEGVAISVLLYDEGDSLGN